MASFEDWSWLSPVVTGTWKVSYPAKLGAVALFQARAHARHVPFPLVAARGKAPTGDPEVWFPLLGIFFKKLRMSHRAPGGSKELNFENYNPTLFLLSCWPKTAHTSLPLQMEVESNLLCYCFCLNALLLNFPPLGPFDQFHSILWCCNLGGNLKTFYPMFPEVIKMQLVLFGRGKLSFLIFQRLKRELKKLYFNLPIITEFLNVNKKQHSLQGCELISSKEKSGSLVDSSGLTGCLAFGWYLLPKS